MFLSRCKPQFYYIKVGFKGVKIIEACFRDVILIILLLLVIIVCLSLLTMTNLNIMREMLLFVCSKMAD